MQKGIKFRIYPNKEQKNLINQTLGCCRLIYNKGLDMRNTAYSNGEKTGYSQTSAMLTKLKKCGDFAFLRVVDSIALQQSLRDLDRGFVNFFKKRAAHPVFKSKHNRHQSYRTINQGENIRIVGRCIKLLKLGYVKIRQSMEVGKIRNVTIEHTPTGKYFAVLNVEQVKNIATARDDSTPEGEEPKDDNRVTVGDAGLIIEKSSDNSVMLVNMF